MVEAAMVGKDGIIGASSALDGRISLSRAIVQLARTPWSAKSILLAGGSTESHGACWRRNSTAH
jgi:hypothetical protein